MNEDRTLLLGMDLCEDYIQISCYNTKTMQADSVSIMQDRTKYRIPTALCARRDTMEWIYGEDAVNCVQSDNTKLITGIIKAASAMTEYQVFDKKYKVSELMEKLFRRILAAVRQRLGGNGIRGIAVTVRDYDSNVISAITEAMAAIGIKEDRLRILTHMESFMYFTVSQNTDIWINSVGLFNFDSEGMFFYRLSYGRKQNPIVIVAEKTDLRESISYEMLETNQIDRLMYAFESTSGLLLHKQIISAVYVTGSGFEGTWADEILKGMCSGRRIFRGQNLYVKGAGHAADILFNAKDSDYLLVCDDVLKSSIALKVYKNAEFTEYCLARMGERYSDAGGELEIILDDTNELDFIIRNIMKKDFICAIMTLDTLPWRENKTIRLRVGVKFPDRDTVVISVHDTGFGEFYQTDYRVWEQILKL